ncbi:MAG: energy transducer TonB [Flavobacteriaceae bacterium]
MNLNRNQLSFLITFFSLSIVILLLYNIQLGSEAQEEYVIEMSLADEDLEKLLEEEEKLLEEMAKADPIKSHMAYNETAKPSLGNPEPLKTLEEIMEEKAAAEDENPSDPLNMDEGYAANLKELAKKREEKKQKLGEKEAQKKEFTNHLAKRKTSVSYSLVDRTSYRLPPPIYTCIEGGKVVVNILVDANGNVVEADFNAKSSGTSNGCLVDNAISYALKARFSSSSRTSQKGTITYIFQSK